MWLKRSAHLAATKSTSLSSSFRNDDLGACLSVCHWPPTCYFAFRSTMSNPLQQDLSASRKPYDSYEDDDLFVSTVEVNENFSSILSISCSLRFPMISSVIWVPQHLSQNNRRFNIQLSPITKLRFSVFVVCIRFCVLGALKVEGRREPDSFFASHPS